MNLLKCAVELINASIYSVSINKLLTSRAYISPFRNIYDSGLILYISANFVS